MGQQQTMVYPDTMGTQHKVSFRVGTKLLISVASLLMGLIAFLSVSAIILLTEDKQAYTFEAKTNEAMLSGQEFANTVGHVVDTLRVSLASVDPTQPVTRQEKAILDSTVRNQTDAALVLLSHLDPETGKLNPITSANNSKLMDPEKLQITPSVVYSALTEDWMHTMLSSLNSDGIGFVNVSQTGGTPLMAVLFADRGHTEASGSIPVGIGIVPLAKLSSEFKGFNLTIATRDGWVLFDTDSATMFSRANISDDPLFSAAKTMKVNEGTNDYFFKSRHYLGGFSKPGFDLVALSRAEWDKAMAATYALTEKFILLGCMAVGLGIIFAILFSKTLTAPINRLYRATQEVAKGKFDLRVDVGSKDEIGALTDSFNTMSGKIQELLQESVEKAILEKEIDVASTVQQTLIPPSNYDDQYIRIRSHYQAASRCGGDWWGFFMSGKKLVFGIADATGHGVPSALITASAHSAFSVLQKLIQESSMSAISPAQLLSYVNRSIHDSSKGNIMMTYFMGVIDYEKQSITYANAAHNPPWLFSRNGDRFKLNSLTSSGSRLGEQADLPPIEEKTISFGPNDILFLYTDGLTEGKSTDGEMFAKKRVRRIVEANLSNGPEAIIDSLISEFLDFNSGKPLDDDVTIAAATFLGPERVGPTGSSGSSGTEAT